MHQTIKEFIETIKTNIKKQSIVLYRQIDYYENLICFAEKRGKIQEVMFYKRQINQCYARIYQRLEIIKKEKERIVVMKQVNKVIKRGDKCA